MQVYLTNTMTCEIRHDYRLVGNHYKDGVITTENWANGGEWVTELRCRECDEVCNTN